MADFALDTAVTGSDGNYRARLSRDWEIWGPNGGYLAAIALRAAGAASSFHRPATFSCHYLSVAKFDEVELRVTSLRRAKRAESLRVSMTQEDRGILEAFAWMVDENEGLEHDVAVMPDVPPIEALRPVEELRRPDDPVHAFWRNFDRRPIGWVAAEVFRPGAPTSQTWIRFKPRATFEDLILDAARSLLLIDTMSWPAAWRAHGDKGYIAPSLDVSVQFHRPAQAHEWLLVDAASPIGTRGLIGTNARVWTPAGELVASGISQLYCRPVR
jgi:acyl-CoA thioesterase II